LLVNKIVFIVNLEAKLMNFYQKLSTL
jgi:hypothetical protein